ncbi:MAG: ATPase [Candidatus Omnitrophica bacterium]|nr:ATPase [Candidatus Omnitrophota bacterium]
MDKLARLKIILNGMGPRLVACSGGLDSLLLSVLSARIAPEKTLIAHALSPAVPWEATERVQHFAVLEHWNLQCVAAGEFEDPQYLKNPRNRCYFCKWNLYRRLNQFRYFRSVNGGRGKFEIPQNGTQGGGESCQILSGANLDDLGEYRPGLDAAKEYNVRHPFIEAEICKDEIRAICRIMGLPFAELPASPCLSSRIYTGTEVTPERLRMVEALENELRKRAGIQVVRCRVRGHEVLIEVTQKDRWKLDRIFMEAFRKEMLANYPGLSDISLDPLCYQPGRAFVEVM